ncbi:MAG: hypothetical protein IB618_03035 [Candidatus Pacearchaeota archaeon]|nr:MAG: hypothetical protein IB618_03035 [Candidatus Pacearchaeota archaeon]
MAKRKKKKVSFWTTKKVKKPVKVKFVDREGNLVSFTAMKEIKKPTKVIFYKSNGKRIRRIKCPYCSHSFFTKRKIVYYCPYCGKRLK